VLSSLGVDWDAWSETTSLSVDDGSVFWLAPDAAPGGEVVVAQLTVPTGSSGTVKMGMQGRATGGGDWNVHEVIFTYPLTVCIDLISFQALLNSVNRACCDDVGEDCSAGYPTVCSTHCAMARGQMQECSRRASAGIESLVERIKNAIIDVSCCHYHHLSHRP
jgi:hypothetical protein